MTPRRGALTVLVVALAVVGLWRLVDVDDGGRSDAVVTVFGPWLDADADAFAEVIADFERTSGLEVRYVGSSDFETALIDRVAAGVDVPDVAIVPQPGLITELVANDRLVPLSAEVTAAILGDFPLQRDAIEVGGEAYLVPYRANVKSLVWYRPEVFEGAGWELPATLDELHDLVDRIDQESTLAPWCFSVAAGSATGWPATDWVEDLVLRRGGPEIYDDWTTGRREFSDETIRAAHAEFEELVVSSGRSAGGRQAILEVPVAATSAPLFGDAPGCAMYKQGSFATGWFPSGTTIGPDGDIDVFVLPGVEAAEPVPLLIGGSAAVQFADRPEVDAFLGFLASPEGGSAWAELGGFLSLRGDDATADRPDVDARLAALLAADVTVRFDASDLAVPEVREVLLDATVDYLAGSSTLDDALATVDGARAGRPVLDATPFARDAS